VIIAIKLPTLILYWLLQAVNTVREAFFLGTYFYTYEGLRVFLQSAVSKTKVVDKDHTAAWTVPIAGGISGAWAWFITFPLDCIKVSACELYLLMHQRKGFLMRT
jgi:hypothetical protein